MSTLAVTVSEVSSDQQHLEDIGFMTCMSLVLMCNYAQTGHFGGPLAYTPFNVVSHLAGPGNGGLRFDYRRPKHPYSDKFMLAAGHCAPTCYALWIIMGEALHRKHRATGDDRYRVAARDGMCRAGRGAGVISLCYRMTCDIGNAAIGTRGWGERLL